MKHTIGTLFFACAAFAAVTNVRVTDITNTQAILRYTAPTDAACAVEVSEAAEYSPLAHDVNGSLFSGANLDSRDTSANLGRDRVFVVGRRTIHTASDQKNYSRALQAATLHYYRITCGSDTATGSFTTQTLPFGLTHTDGYIPDDIYVGDPKYVSVDQADRNFTWIDPHTGVQARMLQRGGTVVAKGDFPEESFLGPRATSLISSTDWTNPSNLVANTPATYATFDGANCSPTCGGAIFEETTGLSYTYIYSNSTDYYKISLTGFGSSATAADRTVNVCVVPNEKVYLQGNNPPAGSAYFNRGTVCDTHAGAIVEQIVLPQSSESTVSITSKFRKPDQTLHIHAFQATDANQPSKPRFMIWKANSSGTISVRNATWGWRGSGKGNVGSAGEFDRCNYNARSDNTYICTSYGDTNGFYLVNGDTGAVTFIGLFKYITGIGPAYCAADHQVFSATDPNVWFCQPNTVADYARMVYIGDGQEKAPGYVLTKDVDFTITWPITGFYSRLVTYFNDHKADYDVMLGGAGNYNRFGVGPFTSCSITNITKMAGVDKFVGSCRSTDADTPSWDFALNADGTVFGLTPLYATAPGRWCTNHYMDINDQPVISIFGQKSQYKTALAAPIGPTDTTITVTSSCSGDCDGFHAGDPVAYSGTMAAEFLQPLQVGDQITLTGYPAISMDNSTTEYAKITAKISATEYQIQRGLRSVAAKSHSAGAAVHPVCSSWTGATGTAWEMYYYYSPDGQDHSAQITWDPVADPRGTSLNGSGIWAFRYYGHTASRKHTFTNGNRVTNSTPGTYVMPSNKLMDTTWYQWEPLGFGGKNGIGTGNAYQSHVAISSVNAFGVSALSLWNAHPAVFGDPFTASQEDASHNVICDIDAAPVDVNPSTGCSVGRVAGTTGVYRYVPKTTPYYHSPKHFATFGSSGAFILHDISGPGSAISDATPYSFCLVVGVDECRTGSTPGQIFVSVPHTLEKPWCHGGEGFGNKFDVCVGNVEWKSSGSSQMVYGINSKTGLYDVAAGYESIANGSGGVRLLARHALAGGYRRMPGFSSTKPLANGKFALADWAHLSEGTKIAVIKVPPIQQTTRDYSKFFPLTVSLPAGALPSSTSNVIAEFGYAESFAPSDLRCNSRAETCVAHRSTINESNPYSYATTESATIGSGLSCASGCSLVIPAFPGRLVYYRVVYRTSGNAVIARSPIRVAAAW